MVNPAGSAPPRPPRRARRQIAARFVWANFEFIDAATRKKRSIPHVESHLLKPVIMNAIGNRIGDPRTKHRVSGDAQEGRQAMEFQISRRSFMAGIGAAATASLPAGAVAREDTGGLAYRTAGELAKGLADRKISAR